MYRVKITVAVGALIVLLTPASVFAQKISGSVTSFGLSEGASQIVQLRLDAPIICPVGSPTCNVVLNFTSSDPTRVGVSPSTVTWNFTDWAQTRTITVSSIPSATYDNGQTVSISAAAVSSSVYYSGFSVQLLASLPMPPAPGVSNQQVTVASHKKVTTDVLANATNDPDPSTVTITISPANGAATNTNGLIAYTPDSGFHGNDSLTYSVCSSLKTSVCSTANLLYTVLATQTTSTSTQTTARTPPAPSTGSGDPGDKMPLLGLSIVSLLMIGLGFRLRTARNSKG